MLYVYYVIRWALCHTVCAHLIIYMHDDTIYICVTKLLKEAVNPISRTVRFKLRSLPFVFKTLLS